MSNFNPELFQCTNCQGTMKSKYSGHFSSCDCGDSFVDQTPYYGRYGGHAKPISDLILEDLVSISGIGYGKSDVLELLAEIAQTQLVAPLDINAEIYAQYCIPVAALGGSSARDLVDAGRGHKVIAYLQAVKEGY